MKYLLRSARSTSRILFERIRSEKLRLSLLQAFPFLLGSVITGLIAVLYTKLFAWAEHGTAYVFAHYNYFFFVLTPVCFIISWWLVKKYSPYARGSGIPQVMAAIELSSPRTVDKVKRLLSLRIIFVKIVSSLVMVLGGGIIGQGRADDSDRGFSVLEDQSMASGMVAEDLEKEYDHDRGCGGSGCRF